MIIEAELHLLEKREVRPFVIALGTAKDTSLVGAAVAKARGKKSE